MVFFAIIGSTNTALYQCKKIIIKLKLNALQKFKIIALARNV